MKPIPPALLALLLFSQAAPAQVESTATAYFPNFESGPTRPLLLTPDGEHLFVLNPPDHRVEIFAAPSLRHEASVFTGLEPVSMALNPARPRDLYVANHLSDSVAVVDLIDLAVKAVIQVGDEPADLVVADGKIFITVARARDIGGSGDMLSNLVVVAQAAPPYAVIDQIPIQGHKPRALEADGNTVYVAPLNSGNHTTILQWPHSINLIGDQTVLDAHDQQFPFELNEALTDPQFDAFVAGQGFGWSIPESGRIVTDSEFPAVVPQLPDNDIFAINATTHALVGAPVTGVGTTLFDVKKNPLTGSLWVACTEARNRTRMEYNLRGAAFENRVTVAQPGGAVQQIVKLDANLAAVEHAQPVALAFYSGPAGSYGYVAAHGTATVLVLDAANPANLVAEIAVGEMPLGLAVDESLGGLYVFTRGDKKVRLYDIAGGHALVGQVLGELPYDPEPKAVAAGRRHLYDARSSTGHGSGNFSCASCHVFGHTDFLAWDLGDSAGGLSPFYADLMAEELSFPGPVASSAVPVVNPMKGPMTTQTLRGVSDDAPFHWKGDRRFFHFFRGAFEGLNGGAGISSLEMQEYAAFLRYMEFPPNPFEPDDRVYTGEAEQGRVKYGMNANGKGYNVDFNSGQLKCIDCHQGNFNAKTDFSGAQPTVNFDGPEELFNTPTLRGVYEKEFKELLGFGLTHTGEKATIRSFMDTVLQVGGMDGFVLHTALDRDQIAEFTRQWDTGHSPLVGRQFHLNGASAAEFDAVMSFWEAQVQPGANNTALVFKGWLRLANGTKRLHGGRWAREPVSQQWMYGTDAGKWVTRNQIRNLAVQGRVEATFTVAPRRTAYRLGVDRDEDGLLDFAETRVHRTDPASPDTDGDGFDDALEVALGTNPRVPDATVPDAQAPVVNAASVEENDVFADAATIHFLADEPATALVEVGLSAGSYGLASFSEPGLNKRHDVLLTGLPAGTQVFYRITGTDHSGNASAPVEGSFTTAPPVYHLEDLTLVLSGAGPYTATAEVLVHDHEGNPVAGIPVNGHWFSDTGDLGGQNSMPAVTTDGAGRALFVLGPYTPLATTKVTFAVRFLGSLSPGHTFFVGSGGTTPGFFYFMPANARSFAAVTIP